MAGKENSLKGISLHIGVNVVDPEHYGGWSGPLKACEFDAIDMELIAHNAGFKTTTLLTKEATRNAVLHNIEEASDKLKDGDIFYISYSGHGGRIPDENGDEKKDKMDETWCLYDGMLIDDELRKCWTKFAKGVRIFMTSDSCHSGTVAKAARYPIGVTIEKPIQPGRVKAMSLNKSLTTYVKNKAFYDKISKMHPDEWLKKLDCTVILISGCQDHQFSYDGDENGTFTTALKLIWNGGMFNENYSTFHRQIMSLLPDNQTPNYLIFGASNKKFADQTPFTI